MYDKATFIDIMTVHNLIIIIIIINVQWFCTCCLLFTLTPTSGLQEKQLEKDDHHFYLFKVKYYCTSVLTIYPLHYGLRQSIMINSKVHGNL